MKVLIFGGTGLVGRPVVEKAVAAGHEVTVFTRNRQNVRQQGVRIVEKAESLHRHISSRPTALFAYLNISSLSSVLPDSYHDIKTMKQEPQ